MMLRKTNEQAINNTIPENGGFWNTLYLNLRICNVSLATFTCLTVLLHKHSLAYTLLRNRSCKQVVHSVENCPTSCTVWRIVPQTYRAQCGELSHRHIVLSVENCPTDISCTLWRIAPQTYRAQCGELSHRHIVHSVENCPTGISYTVWKIVPQTYGTQCGELSHRRIVHNVQNCPTHIVHSVENYHTDISYTVWRIVTHTYRTQRWELSYEHILRSTENSVTPTLLFYTYIMSTQCLELYNANLFKTVFRILSHKLILRIV